MKNYILETCVDGILSLLKRKKAVASRVECAVTLSSESRPLFSLFRQVRKIYRLKVRVLLRPRYGDYCYNPI